MTDPIEATEHPAVVAVATPTMPSCRVRIDAGGREIELESTVADADVNALATTALALWRATAVTTTDPEARSLFGLVTSERAADRTASSTLEEPVEAPR
jgi:hypothetical protein